MDMVKKDIDVSIIIWSLFAKKQQKERSPLVVVIIAKRGKEETAIVNYLFVYIYYPSNIEFSLKGRKENFFDWLVDFPSLPLVTFWQRQQKWRLQTRQRRVKRILAFGSFQTFSVFLEN